MGTITSNLNESDFISMTKGTNERLLSILLPRAISEAERTQITAYVNEKTAFSKKQGLFLICVAARLPHESGQL